MSKTELFIVAAIGALVTVYLWDHIAPKLSKSIPTV